MQKINVYDLYVINDCEGRSSTRKASFSNRPECEKFAQSDQGRDMYGSVGNIKDRTITIFDTADF